MMNEVKLIDCMEYMKTVPDKYYELAIIDPPYGIGMDGGERRTTPNRPNSYTAPLKHEKKDWDSKPPTQEYFNELIRVSKNQIIWGANHFISKIPFDSPCWIVWDKDNGNNCSSDCELAYASFKTAVRKFFGHPFIGTNGGKDRIHPTQKPVALYKWLLKNYAKPGDKIFDSHVGSGSIRIACHDMGFDFMGCELDADYWEAQEERYKQHTMQGDLFSGSDLQSSILGGTV